MRNYRMTVILFIILIAAIAVFFLIDSSKATETDTAIYKFEDKSITEIGIQSEQGEVSFTKTDGKWTMALPKSYKINESIVNSLARRLENFQALRVIEENADDLSKYGLDKPKTVVAFKTSEGKWNTLYIGLNTASNFQVYARRSGSNSVYTVTLTDIEVFGNGDPAAFRERNFIMVDMNAINAFSLDINGTRGMKLTEMEPGKWQFDEPYRVNAKNDAVKEILKGITGLNIKSFIADDAANLQEYGLDKPFYTLMLFDKKGKSQTIYFGRSDQGKKEIFIRLDNEQSIYSVSTEAFNPENVKIGELLNETPLSIGIGKVSRVIIDDKGVISEFDRHTSKADDIFTFKGKTLDNDSFIALYVDLMALTADGYDGGNNGGTTEMTVTYELLENGGSVKLELSKRDDKSYYISVDGKQLPFYVSGQKVDLVRRWIKRVTGM